MRGVEGWGRHLRDGSATAARQHFALTHPSNLRKTVGVVISQTFDPRCALRVGPLAQTGTADWWPRAWLTRDSYTVPSRSSAENPGELARQRHHRDLLSPPGGDPPSPLSQVRRARIAQLFLGGAGASDKRLLPTVATRCSRIRVGLHRRWVARFLLSDARLASTGKAVQAFSSRYPPATRWGVEQIGGGADAATARYSHGADQRRRRRGTKSSPSTGACHIHSPRAPAGSRYSMSDVRQRLPRGEPARFERGNRTPWRSTTTARPRAAALRSSENGCQAWAVL